MSESPEASSRLFLLDGMALTYRAHFAMIRSPRFTTGGQCTSAVFGVFNTVMEIINRDQPTHIAVAFDTAEPTHRHEEFAAYKAQRDAIPEDIASQLPLVFRLFEALNIPVIRCPGFEADDVMATLAGEAEQAGFDTWLVTPDKDFDQLVTDHVFVLKPGRGGGQREVLGVPEVLQKWQIQRVDQVIDILGLMGDASDNIPGIPGIGEKTAQKLIQQYDNVENLLQHAEQLKGKQRERVEQNADQARLSRRLVTILRDVPHGMKLDELASRPPDQTRLRQLLSELQFETLGKRLFGGEFKVQQTGDASPTHRSSLSETAASSTSVPLQSPQQGMLFGDELEEQTLSDVKHAYRIVRTPDEQIALIGVLSQQERICFDTETTGLDPHSAELVGMAFCIRPHEASYVPCPANVDETRAILNRFRPILENPAIGKIGHNLKYDATVLKWHGVELRGRLEDTMLSHTLVDPEGRHNLDQLSLQYFGYRKIPTSDLIGERGKSQKCMRDVDVDIVGQYAGEDVDITWQLHQQLVKEIEQAELQRVCYEVEFPLIPVLVDMEFEGIRLDVEAITAYSRQLAEEIDQLQEKIFDAAGHPFNIDSPKQLGVVLYDELQLVKNPKKTPTGQYTTREAELTTLASKHEIVRDVLDYRNATKLKSVYVDQLPRAVNPKTGRVHTNYSQAWTATGRIQSNNPNLQTIPVRKERGREIRAAFVARDHEHRLLSADYSQIELRILAHLSRDEALIEAFRGGADIHRAVAAQIHGVAPDEVTSAQRNGAKMVNFGIVYGVTPFGLARRLRISQDEAATIIRDYKLRFPGITTFLESCIHQARRFGYVETMLGRRRPITEVDSRNA
ncbi:MAG: DNA polymerase I, partial [Planctomycetales bacterium]|nr:DNA polymerase I [Planctomycetales bacterium]